MISFDGCTSIPFSWFLLPEGVFSVIVYFGILNFQCQITSVIQFFLNFDCCFWYEAGQKWNRTLRCIYCLLQCTMGFHTPQNSGFNMSCKLLMSSSTSFLSTFLHTHYFFFFLTPLSAYVFVSCGLVVFFPF